MWVGWLVGLYLGTVSLTMNLSQFWKHMVAIWSYVLPPKLYEAITLFIPAFLVPDQVDVVLMFCQLQPSTPQSRSIPWWRLLKFKYTYLSVDFYISPSKMAHSSQAPKGARGYCKSGLFVLKKKKKTTSEWAPRSSQLWLPCVSILSLNMTLLKGGTQQHQGNACTSHSGCTKAPSPWCQRPVTLYFFSS